MDSLENSASAGLDRPPLELAADVAELLDLLEAILDPIAERIQPAADEQLGLVFLALIPVEMRMRAWFDQAIKALPGNAPSKP